MTKQQIQAEKDRKKRAKIRAAKQKQRKGAYARSGKLGSKAAANQKKKRRMLKEAGL